ncbi:hypothetical protein CBL_14257 [Carabus blaptoides fortunei]
MFKQVLAILDVSNIFSCTITNLNTLYYIFTSVLNCSYLIEDFFNNGDQKAVLKEVQDNLLADGAVSHDAVYYKGNQSIARVNYAKACHIPCLHFKNIKIASYPYTVSSEDQVVLAEWMIFKRGILNKLLF